MRAGEATSALLLTANVFLILAAYYLIKPVREALILAEQGAVIKSYASAGQAVILGLLVPVYARIGARVDRRRLIELVTGFFIACMLAFYGLTRAGLHIGIPFYLWVGVFNMMIVAQFWAFANDVYTEAEGRRLFAIVVFGSNVGAVGGSFVASRLLHVIPVEALLLVSAGTLGVAVALTRWVDRRELRRRDASAQDAPPLASHRAFALVFKDRYLLLIAVLLLLLNLVNTNGEFILGKVVKASWVAASAAGETTLDAKTWIGGFYANFFGVVNLASMATQLFLVSRIVRLLGVRGAILVLPVIALGGYALLAFAPILGVVRWAKIAENSTDYSLHNTVRAILFLPTSREAKYNAKQVTDTIFVRAGDVLSALLVWVGTTYLALDSRGFALANLGLVCVWLAVAAAIGRRYAQMTRNTPPA